MRDQYWCVTGGRSGRKAEGRRNGEIFRLMTSGKSSYLVFTTSQVESKFYSIEVSDAWLCADSFK